MGISPRSTSYLLLSEQRYLKFSFISCSVHEIDDGANKRDEDNQ